MSFSSATVVLFLLSAVAVIAAGRRLRYDCQPCQGEECDLVPIDCDYGLAQDPCDRWVCAQGPGQRCGGRENHLGTCGEGLTCKCNVCTGCSSAKLKTGYIECYNPLEWNPFC